MVNWFWHSNKNPVFTTQAPLISIEPSVMVHRPMLISLSWLLDRDSSLFQPWTFGAWMFFTGCVPQVVIKEMPNRTLANHFGLRLIHVYVKRRALSNNSLLRNSVGHLSASGQLPFHHAERIPQGAFTDERLQKMPVSQAAALNARLAELGIHCLLYTTQIKVHQKSTLSFMSLTFMSHYWLYLLILWRTLNDLIKYLNLRIATAN